MIDYTFDADLWRYPGKASWHFLTLPKDVSDEIKVVTSDNRNGFGSVRVKVTIKDTAWETSIFPDNKSGCFFLPVKKQVREKCDLESGDLIKIKIQLKI